MLEVDEHVGATRRSRLNRLGPPRDVVRRIPFIAQAEVGVIGRDLDRGRQLLALGHAERQVSRPQAGVDLVIEPRGVAELERRADAWRKGVQEGVEQCEVLFEVGRELEQQRAELGAERGRRFEELTDAVAALAQPCVVRDPLRRLQRELERIRRRTVPPLEDLLVGRTVERVVDLDGREPGCVIRQHPGGRQVRGIETALPFGIVVAGRPDPHGHSHPLRGSSW